MRIIGITGSIACGKSTVSSELERRGFPVVDGDVLSRELTAPGGAAVPDIRAQFGNHMILPDGSMDRRAMAKLVFSDSNAREKLDRLMAPHLASLTRQRLEEVRLSGASLCFLDMALLFEKGYNTLCDAVWCVWLPENVQLKRLMSRDAMTEEEALKRIRCVLSSDRKADLSSAIIDNSGSLESTMSQLDTLLARELSRAAGSPRRRRAGAASPAISDTAVPSFSSEPPVPSAPERMDRPDALRKKPSRRKVSWSFPRPLAILLIVQAALLAVSVTSVLLMNAYLVRRQQAHAAEQRAVDEQYPLLYRETIMQTAAAYNLSPALIAAVIRNESSFRPAAESSVGARGLMQLMPDTAEWIAGKLRFDSYSFDLMYEPEPNIRFGCWYLNYLSSLFGGDPLCVVCAYHAGQGEVSSWLANPLYSDNGATLLAERLPEGPTKQYAGRVTRDYGIYQAKYFTVTQSDSGIDDSGAS